jgi:hypothetical protein
VRDRLAYDEGGLWGDPRRRAKVILLILAMTAALVVSIMVFFVGTSTGHHNTGLIDVGTTAAPTTKPATPTRSTTAASRTPSPSKTTSAAPKPTSTANPCPSAGPCAVDGDDGGALDAVNKFRVSHGRPAVPGTVSGKAQQCALKQGEGPSCEPHFAWEAVPTQDGQKVISMITGRGAGRTWLLDAGITSLSIGWAYAPGSGYECAILKFP